MTWTGLLFTAGVQLTSAIINCHNNKKKVEKIKKLQRDDKEERQENWMRRDYERFKRNINLQMQIEEDAHNERLKEIDNSLLDKFKTQAYLQALNSSPLMISPYVIRNTVMPLFEHASREEVFCFLTNSNDDDFNKHIIPLIDHMLCDTISESWNKNSLHTICYYTDVWKNEKIFAEEDIKNMKSLFRTPTVVITPFIERNGLTERKIRIDINIWNEEIEQCFPFKTDVEYNPPIARSTPELMQEIAAKLCSKAICAMGYEVDAYYWIANNQAPLLPSLMLNKEIECDEETLQSYKEAYIEFFETFVIGSKAGALCNLDSDKVDVIKDNSANTLYFTPERSISFLESISLLNMEDNISNHLLSETLLSIYKARFDEVSVKSLEEIDSNKLTDVDVDIVLELIQLAKKRNCSEVVQKFTNIIRRVIENNHIYQSCQ